MIRHNLQTEKEITDTFDKPSNIHSEKVLNTMIIICMIALTIVLFPKLILAATSIKITNNGKTITYTDKQLKASLNGSGINISKTPGILENGYALLPYKEVFADSKINASTSYNKSKGTLKLVYKNKTILMTLGKKVAYVNGKKKTMPLAPRKVIYHNTNKSAILIPSRFVTDSFSLGYNWNSKTSTVEIKKPGLDLKYDSKWYTYKGIQSKITVSGRKISSSMPGIEIDKTCLVPTSSVFKNASGVSYHYDSKSKVVTLTRNKNTIKLTMGSNIAYVNGVKKTMTTKARLIYLNEKGYWYTMVPVSFVAKNLKFNYKWDSSNKTSVITVPKSDGSMASMTNSSGKELKAMWISYLELGATNKSEEEFKNMIDTMFDNSVSYGMNAVVVQVRPFADALYPSKYFPWSSYVSGKQGSSVNYDPLAYMVSAAHKRGLEFHAWVNPYRVTLGTTSYTSLADNNKAKIWHESKDKKRNVLAYNNNLYFNPAIPEVRTLIVNGVKELVKNYSIDGIHMDDYFYPSFSTSNVSSAFDATEYREYVSTNKELGKSSLSIDAWRRSNVNALIKRIYSEIKSIDNGVAFGVSPAANLSNLRSSLQHYVDIDNWMTKEGYIDYVCPQIYWGFDYGIYSYDKVLKQWAELNTKNKVKLYIGLAVYKAGSTDTSEWKSNTNILNRQVTYTRNNELADGFMFFRYDYFLKSTTQKEIDNLLPLLK